MKKVNLLLSALTVAAVNAYATPPTDVQPNVVGGIETPAYSRPYQVALLMNGRQGCGGTLISPDWVLTAAHCLDSASTSSLTVRVGAHSISRGDGQTIRVSQIINHERWRGANGIRSGYDIALLKLASPAPNQYTPAKLPTAAIESQYANVGAYVTVSGWGLTSNRGRPSDVLREAELPVISNNSCSSLLNFSIPGSVICGGGEGGRSACNGDSGGPYAVRVGSDFYSIGTVSWGIACQGATAFTRTTSYLDWIKQKTGIIDIPNDKPPVADFRYSVNGTMVNFISTSTDDKGITQFDWSFGQGNTSSSAENPSHDYNSNGEYNVTLTVTDTKGQTNSTSQVVRVGTPPSCGENWLATKSYSPGDKVTFNGVVYEAIWWSQGAQPDLYSNVWRKGSDCNGSSDPVPVASFTVTKNNLTVSLQNQSTGAVSYAWNFGDGKTSSVASPTHTYAVKGQYTITLTAKNNQGQSATSSKVVSVGEVSGGCNGLPNWSAEKVYFKGDRVAHDNVIYEANWWVQGENPANSDDWGPWTRIQPCN
ncbi:trypsin-like serine protease [Pseudoalteromonas luteoviolacea]|uniref:trypsin-like serine protease n=1 Tax=Pseudoalteromonas luteoviolacea TaxID=43657 RepID=UPI001B39EBC9|nr:trypsin-like serine protease [Pseudoalteromonas luteoviolacea]MBQ4876390.1 trypsin-like serine protease [Pseudoalteromonas luteoviolacea]MBQ4905021.1 trypsin-like serine protease [Pseudoalteromonas luteoviolacea]